MPNNNTPEYNRQHYERNANRLRINQNVRYSIKMGKTKVPPCQICESNDSYPWFTDYTKPETFEAYCPECRKKEEAEINRVVSKAENLTDTKFDYRDFGKKGQLWKSKK